jgi:hypothetical protein
LLLLIVLLSFSLNIAEEFLGANLHDHFNSYVAWRSTKTGTFNELHRLAAPKACGRKG